MAAQQPARTSPELRRGSTQPALTSELHHALGHYRYLLNQPPADQVMKVRRSKCEKIGSEIW